MFFSCPLVVKFSIPIVLRYLVDFGAFSLIFLFTILQAIQISMQIKIKLDCIWVPDLFLKPLQMHFGLVNFIIQIAIR